MSLEKLQQDLDRQCKNTELNLNEKLLNEESCRLVSDFLREHTQFTSLQIKGCNITPTGFQKICEGLKNNLRMDSIFAEWNQIGGNNSIKGLQALQSLIEENPSIQTIDLSNNNITQQGASIIAEILAVNPQIVNLDLKWNEIGIKGGEEIVDALQSNGNIRSLDISCNKVPEEMIQEVNRIIARNKKGLPVNLQNRTALQQQLIQDQQQKNQIMGQFQDSQKPSAPQKSIRQIQESKAMHQLDKNDQMNKILQMEREKIKEVKKKLNQELEEEARIREVLEKNYHNLKKQVVEKENVIADLSQTYKSLLSENQLYRIDVDSIKRDLNEVSSKGEETCKQLEAQLQQDQKQLAEIEREHQHEQDCIIADHEEYVQNMLRDFQLRYNALDDKYKILKHQKEDLEDKTFTIQENILRFQLDHEEQIRNLKARIADEEGKKYSDSLTQLKSQLAHGKELRDTTVRKNEELVKEIQYKEEKIKDLITDKFNHGYQQEINELKQKINELHKDLSVSNLEIDSEKYKHIFQEYQIDMREEELAERHRDLLRIKDYQREQNDFSLAIHNTERRLYKDNTEQLHQRICELETAVRNQNAENERIKTDYQRVCDNLQHGIGRVINETMANYNDIQRKKPYPSLVLREQEQLPPQQHISNVPARMVAPQHQRVRSNSPRQHSIRVSREVSPQQLQQQQVIVRQGSQPIQRNQIIRQQSPQIIQQQPNIQQPIIRQVPQQQVLVQRQPVIVQQQSPLQHQLVQEQQQLQQQLQQSQ